MSNTLFYGDNLEVLRKYIKDGQCPVVSNPPMDPYLDKMMMMDMGAMSGNELNMMFLKSMIGHHSEAIAIAERALAIADFEEQERCVSVFTHEYGKGRLFYQSGANEPNNPKLDELFTVGVRWAAGLESK